MTAPDVRRELDDLDRELLQVARAILRDATAGFAALDKMTAAAVREATKQMNARVRELEALRRRKRAAIAKLPRVAKLAARRARNSR